MESLFNKVAVVIKKRLEHKCFPVNIAIFLRTNTLKNICECLLQPIESLRFHKVI